MIVLPKRLKVNLYLLLGLIGWAMVSVSSETILIRTTHAAQAPDQILDLVFVIDNSGSMKKNDPKFMTPQLVSTFVRQLPQNSQVGMLLFDI
ncbi:MAG: hypothetical protein PVH22_15310, partial [Desulfobacteraceae bacterium]